MIALQASIQLLNHTQIYILHRKRATRFFCCQYVATVNQPTKQVQPTNTFPYQSKELSPELIHEFIDRIVVHAPRYLDGKRHQLIDIYYSSVGIIWDLSPEEMERDFQEALADQRQGKAESA